MRPFICSLLLLVLWLPRYVAANGWEHTAISLEALVIALEDKNVSLRLRAAQSLGFRPQVESINALTKRLSQGESSIDVRKEIFHSLGRIGKHQAVPAITQCIATEEVNVVKAECIRSIRLINAPSLEPLVFDHIESESEVIRRSAISSLGAFTTKKTIDQLATLIQDADPAIANLAIIALGRTKAASAAPILVSALREAKTDRGTLNVLHALINLRDKSTTDAIHAIYSKSDHAEIKRTALIAMSATDGDMSKQYFLDALSSADTLIKIQSLIILRGQESQQDIEAVVSYGMQDLESYLTKETAELLDQPNQTLQTISLLNEYLKTIIAISPKQGARLYQLSVATRNIPRTSAINLNIAQGLYQARWQGIYGSGYVLNDPHVDSWIIEATKDSDPRIRAVATRSLGVRETASNIPLVQSLLSDPIAEVRWTAARVLGRLKSMSSVPFLTHSITDTSSMVRVESSLSLGYLLQNIQGEKNSLHVQEAVTALTKQTHHDTDSRVRQAAAYALTLIH